MALLNLQLTKDEWLQRVRTPGLKPSRAMGQNFLVEPEVVQEITGAAEIEPGARVIEVGPGLGILTRELLDAGAVVTGVELDDDLASWLESDLANVPQFNLVRKDARHVDVTQIIDAGQLYVVVANLPYSVATVIIRHFIDSEHPPERMTVMVQKEVAERMVAEPPEMSLLALATQLYTEPVLQFVVAPEAFVPAPKVESAVLTLHVREEIPTTSEEGDRLFVLATMAFQRKRKTIANGLAMGLERAKAEVESSLNSIDIDPMRRPQTLTLDEWITLTRALPA